MSKWRALEDISKERTRQDEKWGDINAIAAARDPYVWMAILAEEVGELSHEFLEAHDAGPEVVAERYRLARVEAVQVSAVAVSIIEWLDREAAP